MIFHGAQIQGDGHGTGGLLPNSTLSSIRSQLPSSTVLADSRMSLCSSVISHRHFNREVSRCPTKRTGNRFM